MNIEKQYICNFSGQNSSDDEVCLSVCLFVGLLVVVVRVYIGKSFIVVVVHGWLISGLFVCVCLVSSSFIQFTIVSVCLSLCVIHSLFSYMKKNKVNFLYIWIANHFNGNARFFLFFLSLSLFLILDLPLALSSTYTHTHTHT